MTVRMHKALVDRQAQTRWSASYVLSTIFIVIAVKSALRSRVASSAEGAACRMDSWMQRMVLFLVATFFVFGSFNSAYYKMACVRSEGRRSQDGPRHNDGVGRPVVIRRRTAGCTHFFTGATLVAGLTSRIIYCEAA